jgi:hypothetical protein
MGREDAVTLVGSWTDAQITKRMFTQTPWIFSDDSAGFSAWRLAVSEAAACSPNGVFVVGSCSFGYSLSPLKPGRAFRRGARFDERSDIDVVIVSKLLFDAAWDAVRHSDAIGTLAGTREGRDKVRTDVYWGYVGNANVPSGTGPARTLRGAMGATTSRAPFRGHVAKARVYRHYDDLVGYHLQSLRALRKELSVAQ